MIQIRVDSDYESDDQASDGVAAFAPFDRKEHNTELIEVVVLSDTPTKQPVSEKSLMASNAKVDGRYYQVMK